MSNLPVETYDVVNIDAVAATIRQMESGGNYTALTHGTNGASGAYQFEPGTWQGLSKQFANQVPQASMYPIAAQAPPSVQDSIAKAYIGELLTQNNNNVAAIPAIWYVGNLQTADAEWNSVPAGNSITVHDYVTKWLNTFHGISGSNPGSTSVASGVAGAVTNVGGIAGQAVNGVVSAITTPLQAITAIWGAITNPTNWKHILEVIGGAVLVIYGLVIFTDSLGLVDYGSMAGKAAKVAAV